MIFLESCPARSQSVFFMMDGYRSHARHDRHMDLFWAQDNPALPSSSLTFHTPDNSNKSPFKPSSAFTSRLPPTMQATRTDVGKGPPTRPRSTRSLPTPATQTKNINTCYNHTAIRAPGQQTPAYPYPRSLETVSTRAKQMSKST